MILLGYALKRLIRTFVLPDRIKSRETGIDPFQLDTYGYEMKIGSMIKKISLSNIAVSCILFPWAGWISF